MAAIFLGIESGGTKLQLVVGDEQGRILRRWRALIDRDAGGPGVCRQIERGVKELDSKEIQAVGMGFGGPIDWRAGRVCLSHQLRGWENFELGNWLRELTGAPVAVDNDANVAALGETLSGAGQDARSVFYITLGSGVGGGFTVDGQIYHGETPGECEFGHVRLDRSGNTVESRCCGWAIDARIRALRQSDPQSILCKLIGATPGGEAKHLSAALAQNDPAAQKIFRKLTDDLAFGLSHVVHLLHPQRIVLGGGLSMIGEPLRRAVASALPAHIMAAFAPGPAICLAVLGEDAVPVGALHLARRTTDSHR